MAGFDRPQLPAGAFPNICPPAVAQCPPQKDTLMLVWLFVRDRISVHSKNLRGGPAFSKLQDAMHYLARVLAAVAEAQAVQNARESGNTAGMSQNREPFV